MQQDTNTNHKNNFFTKIFLFSFIPSIFTLFPTKKENNNPKTNKSQEELKDTNIELNNNKFKIELDYPDANSELIMQEYERKDLNKNDKNEFINSFELFDEKDEPLPQTQINSKKEKTKEELKIKDKKLLGKKKERTEIKKSTKNNKSNKNSKIKPKGLITNNKDYNDNKYDLILTCLKTPFIYIKEMIENFGGNIKLNNPNLDDVFGGTIRNKITLNFNFYQILCLDRKKENKNILLNQLKLFNQDYFYYFLTRPYIFLFQKYFNNTKEFEINGTKEVINNFITIDEVLKGKYKYKSNSFKKKFREISKNISNNFEGYEERNRFGDTFIIIKHIKIKKLEDYIPQEKCMDLNLSNEKIYNISPITRNHDKNKFMKIELNDDEYDSNNDLTNLNKEINSNKIVLDNDYIEKNRETCLDSNELDLSDIEFNSDNNLFYFCNSFSESHSPGNLGLNLMPCFDLRGNDKNFYDRFKHP